MSSKTSFVPKVYIKFYEKLETAAQNALEEENDRKLREAKLWKMYDPEGENKEADKLYRKLFKTQSHKYNYFFYKLGKAKKSSDLVPVDIDALCDAFEFMGYQPPEGFTLETFKSAEKRLKHWGTIFLQENFSDDKKYNYYLQLLLESTTSTENDQGEDDISEIHKDKRKGNLIGAVPSRIDDFVGRGKELENLYEVLSETENIVFLHGMPGIGKTSLVKSFVKKYRYQFDNFVWISITGTKDEFLQHKTENTPSQLEQSCMQLYLDLTGDKSRMDWSISQQFKYVINLLNKEEGNNLLIIDNYDQSILSDRHNNKLPHTSNWKILVTGRSPVANLKNVPLNSLSEQEAKSLFEKFCSKKVDESLLEAFLKEIDRHTLMIEIAAKTLNGSSFITLEDLYEKLKQGNLDDPKLDYSIGTEYSADEAKLIDQFLCLFDIGILDQDEITILKTWYYLRPDSYTEEEISQFTAIPFQGGKLKPLLIQLSKKGWIVYNSANRNFSLHRLIQKTVYYALKPALDAVKPLLKFHTSFLSSDENKYEFRLKINCAYLLGQVRDHEMANLDLGVFLAVQAKAFEKMGLIIHAKFYFEKAINVIDKFTDSNPLFLHTKRDLMSSLGRVLFKLYEFENAEEILLDALQLGSLEFEEDIEYQRNTVCTIYCLLTMLYIKLGDAEKSQSYFLKLQNYVGPESNSSEDRAILQTLQHMYLQFGYYDKALNISTLLLVNYNKAKANGLIKPLEYAHGILDAGYVLEKLNKHEVALQAYNFAIIEILKVATSEPLIHDMAVANAFSHIAKLSRKMGKENWKDYYIYLWEIYQRHSVGQPKLWTELISISLLLLKNIDKPMPDRIISIVRESLVIAYNHCKNTDDWDELINIIKEAFGWSQKDFTKFINDIIDEVQKKSSTYIT